MVFVSNKALEDRISQYNRSIVDFYATKKDLTDNYAKKTELFSYAKNSQLDSYAKADDFKNLKVKVENLEKRLNANDASSLSGITSSGIGAVGTGASAVGSALGSGFGLFGTSSDQPPPIPTQAPTPPTKKGGIKKSRKRIYKRKSYKKRTNK